MESVSFTYDGGISPGVAVAHITGASVGVEYRFFCSDSDSSVASGTAVSSTLDLTVNDIGGDAAGFLFSGRVRRQDTLAWVGADVFSEGTPGDAPFDWSGWDTDGANPPTVELTFTSTMSVHYGLQFLASGGINTVDVGFGTGFEMIVQGTSTAPGSTTGYVVQLVDLVTGEVYANRVFEQGTAGVGSLGNPTTRTGSVIVTLDGVDVTQFAVNGSWTRRLNRPSTGQVRINMEAASAPVGCALKIEALINGAYELVHHGRVLNCETDTAEDGGYTVYNSTDPMELWQWRPVRDNDCDFSNPLINQTYTTGPQIIEAALQNSIYCGDGSQADCEGDLFLTINAAAGGGVDLSGAPVDWPMTIAELASLFISTGEVDIVITPTDPGGGIMGEVDFYNGNYGTDRSADIVFSYGMGDFNVRRLRWNEDMTNMANKVWYYGGPKVAVPSDPDKIQHWCWNITGSDGGAGHIPPYTGGLAYPPGGDLSPPASSTNNQIGVLRAASEAAYGVRMDIQIFDSWDEDCVPGIGTPGRNLYRRRWQQESWLRAQPRSLIHITPTRETQIGTFDVGDIVGVEATAAVRGGFSGAQRVYEYTVSWDADGVLELSELQTSSDNEGL